MRTERVVLTLGMFLFAMAAGFCAAPAVAAVQEVSDFSYTSTDTVAEAQAILQHIGFLKSGTYKSGQVDSETISGIQRFQRAHFLEPTGQLDKDTLATLLQHRPETDSDGDGVADVRDKCPNTPRGAKVDTRGCPKDADGDGVADGLDKCPDTPKGVKVDADGCTADSDGDGVTDDKDRCPDTPRGAKVDARGCPLDADGDGVADDKDRCPDTPRGTKVDDRGCPLDSDGDGVTDDKDRCPDTPRGTKVDDRGCEVKAAVVAAPLPEVGHPLVLQGVNFDTNSAHLTSDSLSVLDQVAEGLKTHSDVRLEVGGHTDSSGSASFNKKLSKSRADAVRDYLIGKGVEASRLETKGYGPADPIADNKTVAGRAKNRRVELSRLK